MVISDDFDLLNNKFESVIIYKNFDSLYAMSKDAQIPQPLIVVRKDINKTSTRKNCQNKQLSNQYKQSNHCIEL